MLPPIKQRPQSEKKSPKLRTLNPEPYTAYHLWRFTADWNTSYTDAKGPVKDLAVGVLAV